MINPILTGLVSFIVAAGVVLLFPYWMSFHVRRISITLGKIGRISNKSNWRFEGFFDWFYITPFLYNVLHSLVAFPIDFIAFVSGLEPSAPITYYPMTLAAVFFSPALISIQILYAVYVFWSQSGTDTCYAALASYRAYDFVVGEDHSIWVLVVSIICFAFSLLRITIEIIVDHWQTLEHLIVAALQADYLSVKIPFLSSVAFMVTYLLLVATCLTTSAFC